MATTRVEFSETITRAFYVDDMPEEEIHSLWRAYHYGIVGISTAQSALVEQWIDESTEIDSRINRSSLETHSDA